MATAWQKAMRGPAPRRGWVLGEVTEIRQDTYQIEIDGGKDGFITARLYPDGSVQSIRNDLTRQQIDRIKKILLEAAAKANQRREGRGVIHEQRTFR